MTQPEKLYTYAQIRTAAYQASNDGGQPTDVLGNLEDVAESHEARTLRHKLKTANKELGRAGARMYELRAQLAEVRGLISPNNRTSHRTLAQKNRELNETINLLRKQLDDAAINWVPRQQLEDLAERLAVAHHQLEATGVRVTTA